MASLHPDWHPVQPDQLPCPLDDEQVTLIYYHSCHVMYVVFSFPAVCVVATFFGRSNVISKHLEAKLIRITAQLKLHIFWVDFDLIVSRWGMMEITGGGGEVRFLAG